MVLEEWPLANGIERHALTTIANWRGYGSVEAGGVFYGQKAHSLRNFIDLPRRTGARFELALAIDPGESRDLAALAENGWNLVDTADETGTWSVRIQLSADTSLAQARRLAEARVGV